MSKAKADALVKGIIKTLTVAVNNLQEGRLIAAIELHHARNAVNWSMTKYKYWTHFCDAEVNMSTQSICRYVAVGTNINRLGYSEKDCREMIKGLGWDKFGLGLSVSKRKLSVAGFIKKYKNYDFYPSKSNSGDAVKYAFTLTKDDAAILDGHLETLGMVINDNGYRTGLRDAMSQLVQTRLG